MSADGTAAVAVAHDRALADWIEAEAIVAAVRRAAAVAAQQAAERAQDARMLRRAGRDDTFAAGVADAAILLARRAEAEERRLEAALRAEALLRARVVAAKAALEGRRAQCGAPGEERAACG